MWYLKRKNERARGKERLQFGWRPSHPWYETAAGLQSVIKGNSYQWNLKIAVDPTPKELAHWICKEMQTNMKHAKYTITWLLLYVMDKLK